MSIQIVPVLEALKRNKAAAILVILQVALMLTFISNLVSIVNERIAVISRPTGAAERELFAIGFRLTKDEGSLAMLAADLNHIRALAGVADAVATNAYPLRGTGWGEGISLAPGPTPTQQQNAQTAVYALDEHGIGTLGLKLTRGRNFRIDEIVAGEGNAPAMPGVAIISLALKHQLFGAREALGEKIYVTDDSRKPITIIGVVERLQSPYAAGTVDEHASENSLITPIIAAGASGLFVVRVKPGTMNSVMHEVQATLTQANPNRVFGRLRPFEEIRRSAYQKDRAVAIAFSILFIVLAIITALAIVGLTSFWVLRRTLQIGIRRALGATRLSVVRYFLIENALLCSTGACLGMIGSVALNLWLRSHYGSDRISALALLACTLMVISLGQCAALLPVLRAARVSPSQAFRTT